MPAAEAGARVIAFQTRTTKASTHVEDVASAGRNPGGPELQLSCQLGTGARRPSKDLANRSRLKMAQAELCDTTLELCDSSRMFRRVLSSRGFLHSAVCAVGLLTYICLCFEQLFSLPSPCCGAVRQAGWLIPALATDTLAVAIFAGESVTCTSWTTAPVSD